MPRHGDGPDPLRGGLGRRRLPRLPTPRGTDVIVRHRDSWRIADLVEELPSGQSLVLRSDVYDVWPRHYTERLDPADLDQALMWLRERHASDYSHFLTIMLGLSAPENVEEPT